MATEPEIAAWFATKVPAGWFHAPTEVVVDGDEVLVSGRLPEGPGSPEERIARFREESREERMRIAEEGERRFRRKVSWGASAGDQKRSFTTLSMPVMTRLRQPERQVLDTLIAAGVARSRSEPLNWCVRLVQRNTDDWLGELRDSLEHVQRVRAQGPDAEPEDAPGDAD